MLTIGIVGLPNVGKSTLFNALTLGSALVANYPFATIEPNVGIVNVPDERLAKLATLYKSEKIVPATVRFVDIAGLVAGASNGEGLGNRFLAHIRGTSVIVEVVRAFRDSQVTHVEQSVNPAKDIEIITTELVLADLQTVTRKLNPLEKEARADPKLKPLLETYKEAFEVLDSGRPLYPVIGQGKLGLLIELQLLTAKPVIYVFNVDETDLSDSKRHEELSALVPNSPVLLVNAKLESELAAFEEEEAKELMQSYGLKQSGLDSLVQLAYEKLGLQSYLTAGEKEVRSWTIPIGATAPDAAGVIHGDFKRGFIAAEVVSYQDLVSLGSLSAARAAGKVRTEGKGYIVKPDDVIEFRFNV